MQVKLFTNNYYSNATNYGKRCKTETVNQNQQTSFGGALSDVAMEKALTMLKSKVTDIKFIKDLSEIHTVAEPLMKKYDTYGIKSLGMVIIPENKLGEFANEKLYGDLSNYQGICIGIGDKHGPVESWSKAYQSIVVLFPKKA